MSELEPTTNSTGGPRGYEVRLTARTTNDHHLEPPLELPEGIKAEIEGSEIVFSVPVRARDARTALADAQATVHDLLLVLASTFNGFELFTDKRQQSRRTDAVYPAI